MNTVIENIKNRRSTRAYKSDLLKKEELAAIVEAGIYAPTGHNQQPWHFSVIQDRTILDEANRRAKAVMVHSDVDWIKKYGENPDADIFHRAPALIFISTKKDGMTGFVDSVAAMENMMLAAESLGIGSCWMGLLFFVFKDAELMKSLGIPEGYEPQQAAVFGYKPDGAKKTAPARNMDVTTYIGSF